MLLRDPRTVAIDRVYANGKLAAVGNEYRLPIPKIDYPRWALQTINIGRALGPADFRIDAKVGGTQCPADIDRLQRPARIVDLGYRQPIFVADGGQLTVGINAVDRHGARIAQQHDVGVTAGRYRPDPMLDMKMPRRVVAAELVSNFGRQACLDRGADVVVHGP